MCGIAGIYGVSDKPLLKRMCNVIEHRGPDDSGYYVDDAVSIGMRRLSIIDLAGGRQPIFNEDGNIVVVFNGEIYNFRELRYDLEQKGHRFTTDSDTEVIVHAYEEYGYDCLDRFNGMFAIALWDMDRRKLFLARDRVGIKPLYYAAIDGVLVFGSEIKSILEYGIKREVDVQALADYFVLRYVPAPRTMFKGIRKLDPGCYMVVNTDGIEKKSYWNLEFKTIPGNEDYFSNNILKMLKNSVKRRLIADVPLGVFLSGGVDSSTITAIASEFSSEPVKTFSVGFYGAKYDETSYARNAAEYFETDHTEEWVDIDNADILPELIYQADEPLADPAMLPTYLISKVARKKVKVVLSGEGGDEAFAGYDHYASEIGARNMLRCVPGLLRKLVFKLGEEVNECALKKYLLYVGSRTTHEDSYSYRLKLRDGGYLNTDILRTDGVKDNTRALFHSDGDYLNCMLGFDINYWLPDDLLMKVDKMTMANSLEARVPFLDHELLQLVCGVPSGMKLGKRLLKMSVKELLPAEVMQRKKHGFDVPIKEWFKGDTLDEYLSEEMIGDTPYLDSKGVHELWGRHRSGKGDYGVLLWKCLCYVGWYDAYW
ncbi:MAG: asparagine synthase (glutamine-hydrolysing) [Candidatus Argoarchaeum ethanivorans]|uniref:Putative asparagine synthetase [glutamine-hydrolyzing] n=1 Tax=Candidatus Argoarchaeum ethanivorans TaxID=2608793 RepID=A0A8B3S319_9EURY|nr:MAG: asparagine synthase (glutamine-hydrolysing) [Candidatus Argoarchaeum ethanivorans]